jgi:hypothetical protein
MFLWLVIFIDILQLFFRIMLRHLRDGDLQKARSMSDCGQDRRPDAALWSTHARFAVWTIPSACLRSGLERALV